MGKRTGIAWCDHTFNPWIGCTEVSAACDHCYARTEQQDRYHRAAWGNHPRHRTGANTWKDPLRWNRDAHDAGIRRKVFCASLADVFDNKVDPGWRRDLWDLILCTPALDWLLLTKRPQNIAAMLPAATDKAFDLSLPWPWPNVWLGTTTENQVEADRRVPRLLAVPALKHFLSCEPTLGPIDLNRLHGHTPDLLEHWWESCLSGKRFDPWSDGDVPTSKIDWVIAGGESGSSARPMHPAWPRSLRDQCAAAGTAFFFKQWGEWAPHQPAAGGDLGGDVRSGRVTIVHPTGQTDVEVFNETGINTIKGSRYMKRVGKNAAGALLDGREHQARPV